MHYDMTKKGNINMGICVQCVSSKGGRANEKGVNFLSLKILSKKNKERKLHKKTKKITTQFALIQAKKGIKR